MLDDCCMETSTNARGSAFLRSQVAKLSAACWFMRFRRLLRGIMTTVLQCFKGMMLVRISKRTLRTVKGLGNLYTFGGPPAPCHGDKIGLERDPKIISTPKP